MARRVLISDTASAPPSCGGLSAGGDVGGVGRELDDKRLRGPLAGTQQHLLEGARVGADVKAGLDVGTGDVELDGGDLAALIACLDKPGELIGARAHDVGDERRRIPAALSPTSA